MIRKGKYKLERRGKTCKEIRVTETKKAQTAKYPLREGKGSRDDFKERGPRKEGRPIKRKKEESNGGRKNSVRQAPRGKIERIVDKKRRGEGLHLRRPKGQSADAEGKGDGRERKEMTQGKMKK